MNKDIFMSSREKKLRQNLKRRYASEFLFKLGGIFSLLVGFSFLLFFFYTIISTGYPAFQQTYILIDIDKNHTSEDVSNESFYDELNYQNLIRDGLREIFPDVSERSKLRNLYSLVSSGGIYEFKSRIIKTPSLYSDSSSFWILADDEVDTIYKSESSNNFISEDKINFIKNLENENRIKLKFNTLFFTSGDSRDPELAGIASSSLGSIYMLFITFILSFPIGIAAAIYLEEFAPKSRWTDFISVNISNLAAVPSIIYGLLGLALFINFFHLPRSAPLVGGLVLSLMTLPVIIISSRVSLSSVPSSIRDAALGVGASKMQMISHHVLPLALPGMLTGSIIGMARALGESAPLLMIGMVAFIVDKPSSVLDPSTALPVQVYLWADSPERAFNEKTSAAIMILLLFLFIMNASAIYFRKKFEKRW
ncbi:MAG: phosphate ABC transporter permease PstA [Pseudomonadota bacterium]|nr:phosphate ABC transporter permease PstA [Pseudomonadota bacterium]